MKTDRELLEQALDVLMQLHGGCTDSNDGSVEAITIWCPEIIAAIKERLAQPEQRTGECLLTGFCAAEGHSIQKKQSEQDSAYREASRLAESLFKKHYSYDEEYMSGSVVWGVCDTITGVISQIDNMVCNLILPKEQEPIGYVHKCANYEDSIIRTDINEYGEMSVAVFTTPPARPWQSLTDEDIEQGQKESWVEKQAFESACWWAEAKLKEKNT